MIFRNATVDDISAIAEIYEQIHTEEEAGRTSVGWIRGVYPTERTAEASLLRGDLFVAEDKGIIVGAAIINQLQALNGVFFIAELRDYSRFFLFVIRKIGIRARGDLK